MDQQPQVTSAPKKATKKAAAKAVKKPATPPQPTADFPSAASADQPESGLVAAAPADPTVTADPAEDTTSFVPRHRAPDPEPVPDEYDPIALLPTVPPRPQRGVPVPLIALVVVLLLLRRRRRRKRSSAA